MKKMLHACSFDVTRMQRLLAVPWLATRGSKTELVFIDHIIKWKQKNNKTLN